ncbi:Lrp/AsnC family transcriptional regulator [Demequina iriomotensis]|uniref:Lrp/AsnC family transcriptional regulator n=1 Tax=Demequina iriomotensis TaxID=1536641 RepID=UPI0007863D3F|nr:Lrp/AsnC family transcriptional regulator [Demequina iriomotensis]
MSLDDLDRRIIDELRLDGRASYAEMGLRIGLSPSAVKRRVDRMLADKVIQGFRVRLDPELDSGGTEAYVEVFCRGTVAPEELRRILASIPNVVEAFTVTGQADAIVRLRAATMPDLEAALEKVRLAPQVDKTRSAIVLSRLVESRVD